MLAKPTPQRLRLSGAHPFDNGELATVIAASDPLWGRVLLKQATGPSWTGHGTPPRQAASAKSAMELCWLRWPGRRRPAPGGVWLGWYSVVTAGAALRAAVLCCGPDRRSRSAWLRYPVAGAARQPRFRSGRRRWPYPVMLRNRGCPGPRHAHRGWPG
jgi:hypothetical protein